MEIKVTFCTEEGTLKFFREKLETIEQMLIGIQYKEIKIMSQLDDLNKAISDEDVELTTVQASIVSVAADVAKLKAAVAAGASPTDLTAQIAAVQAHLTSLTTGNQQLVDADKAANA